MEYIYIYIYINERSRRNDFLFFFFTAREINCTRVYTAIESVENETIYRKGETTNDPGWTWTHCWTVEYFSEKWPPTRICMVRFSCNVGQGKTERGRSSPWKITPFATSKMSRTDLLAVHHALLSTRVTTPWFIRVAPAREASSFFFFFFLK